MFVWLNLDLFKLSCLIFIFFYIAKPTLAQENQRFNLPVPPTLDNNQDQREPSQFNVPQIDPIRLPAGQEQSLFDIVDDVQVRSVSFQGNTVVSDNEIQSILSEYVGQFVNSEDLKELEARISELYAEQGYLLSSAFISPETTITDNQLNISININEAEITKITVVGAGRLNSYIRGQLIPLEGELLNANKIYNEMRFLLDEERIEDLKMNIIQTPEIEKKELLFNAKVDNPLSVTLALNNERSPSVGSFQRILAARYDNPLGQGDQIMVDYRNTDGSNIVGIAYDLPINSSGSQLHFNNLYSNTKIVSEELGQFDIRGQTQIFAVGFSQPILRRSSNEMMQEFNVGIRASHTRNSDTILGFSFPLTEGSNDDGKLNSTKLDLIQDYTYRSRRHYLFLGSEFSLGLGLGTENAEEFGNGEFFKWSGQALYSYIFSDRFRSISFFNLQLADRDLIGTEQFSLGGRGSVRSSSSNQISRTNGGHFTQEFRYKAHDDNGIQLELSTFLDFGTAWNNQPQILETDESAAGIGVGAHVKFSDRIRGSIEYAFPLFGQESATQSLQDQGLWLNLQFSF